MAALLNYVTDRQNHFTSAIKSIIFLDSTSYCDIANLFVDWAYHWRLYLAFIIRPYVKSSYMYSPASSVNIHR